MNKSNKVVEDKLRVFSVFSGIGGFELGLLNSDYEFEIVGYSEIDKYASSIYERNFKDVKNYGDATEINTGELPDFDLLVGGFPCQAFSIAGKRKGFDDTRGTLFFELARILRDKKPRYFLFENVKGLLSHDKGKTFQTILEIIDELGYNVQWNIYNSKNYGVPQNRERVFIKGYTRNGCAGEVLFKTRDSRENLEKIKIYGYTRPSRTQSSIVYDEDGLSPTLSANNKDQTKVKTRDIQREYIDKGRSGVLNEHDAILGTLTAEGQFSGGRQFVGVPKIEKVGNVYKNTGSNGDVYSTDGLSPTILTGTKGNMTKILEDNREIIKEGNVFKGGGQAGNVYSTEGLSTTLTANGGGAGGKTGLYKIPTNDMCNVSSSNQIMESDRDINVEHITRPVTRRKYKLNDDELKGLHTLLLEHKKDSGLSNEEISKEIGLPISTVEHYFRKKMDYWSIPDKEIWDKLKTILDIKETFYDDFITVYETVPGVYDSTNRLDGTDGVSPTLTSCKTETLIKEKIEDNFTEYQDGKYVTTTKDNDNVYALNTRQRNHPLSRKQDNYVLEKGDNDDRGIETVGNCSPSKHWRGNVLGTEGISRCLTCNDYKQPVIIKDDDRCIETVGNISPSNHGNGNVYNPTGLSPTLLARDYKDSKKIIIEETDNEEIRSIKKVGNFSKTNHHGKNVYSKDGISPTVTSGSTYKNGLNILEKDDDNRSIQKIGKIGNNNYNHNNVVYDKNGLSPTLTQAMGAGGGHKPLIEEKPVLPVQNPDYKNKKQNGRRVKCDGEPSYSLNASDTQGVSDGFRIRRLTPVECERLQNFPDNWTKYGKDDELISDTQRYKCVGNAVTTSVITSIINEMFSEGKEAVFDEIPVNMDKQSKLI